MTNASMIDLVRQWFEQVGQAVGPILPDGWFGRPYDNRFSLLSVQGSDEALTVCLSQSTSLIFERLQRVYVEDSDLIFEGFGTCVLRWKEYGGTGIRERRVDAGQVRLVAPVGKSVKL